MIRRRTVASRRPRGLRRALLVTSMASIAALLSACGATSAPSGGATGDEEPAVYRMPISDPGSDIDPLTAADSEAMLIAGLASEPLISLDGDGELVPRLATEWEASDDGLTWTVLLRDGAQFNDGQPVTAADVVSTFDTIMADDSLSPGKSAFVGILEHVAATDDGAVQFSLVRPFSDFPRLLTGANTGILPDGYEPGHWLDDPVGAGQFMLEDYTVGVSATFAKNPRYWNADAIGVDGVELTVYADTQAQLLAFEAGQIDRIRVTSDVLAAVDPSQYDIVGTGYNKFDGIFMDVTSAPFDDRDVREAVAWAIDRPALVDDVYSGNADVANDTLFFPDYPVQPTGLTQREWDPDRVAELLDGRTVQFDITTDNQLMGEVLQQQLNAVDGFDVGLRVVTTEQYYAGGDDAPWLNAPFTVTNWGVRSPSQFVSLIFAGDAAWNASHYDNPDIEEAAAAFDASVDEADRQRLADEIAGIQWRDLAVIVPTFSEGRVLQNRRVDGDFVGPLDFFTGYSFAGVSIEG